MKETDNYYPQVKAYFTACIRGRKGNKATFEEMQINLETGISVGRQIQSIFGEILDLYVPHEHDELIQVLMKNKKLDGETVVGGDLEILDKRDVILVYAPEGYFSQGMQDEVDFAKRKGMPIYVFEEISNRTILDVLDFINRILQAY